ncbi:hypothetical protein [Streptomyces sp. NPDC002132]|uniref:hypothetical protein n=1 Tax=unclassified Streptomyces TaxID=2593676 RepID=UPI0033325C60
MPDPSTTRLALYKSKSDGSETVNYSQDIGQNWDKVDAAVGFASCTSTTRPSSPYSGKPIMETDTGYRTYFSNGTAPASASWVQIPNSSSTFNADLDLTSGKQLNIGSSGSNAAVAVVMATATDDLVSGRVSGDTQSRYLVEADGATYWGPGNAVSDIKLYRSGAGVLRTDTAFYIGTNLTVAGSAGVTGAASIGGNLTLSGTLNLQNQFAEDAATRTTTSTTYGNASAALSRTITVPPSGKVWVYLRVTQRNSTTSNTITSFNASGSTTGSVYTANDTAAMIHAGAAFGANNISFSLTHLLTGMIAGETLTVTFQHRVNNAASTGTFDYRSIGLAACAS